MQFTQQDSFYQVARVTGPTHNFLSVELVTGVATLPQIQALPGFCHAHQELDPSAVLAHVQEGLVLANQQFGTNYAVSQVQYRLGDSPPEVTYGILIIKIIEHLTSGGTFTEAEATEEPDAVAA